MNFLHGKVERSASEASNPTGPVWSEDPNCLWVKKRTCCSCSIKVFERPPLKIWSRNILSSIAPEPMRRYTTTCPQWKLQAPKKRHSYCQLLSQHIEGSIMGPWAHGASCFCPMRWTLSIAWASADGFQAGSTNITRLAPVTVSPVPPTCMLKPGWSWQIHTGQVQRKGSCNASGFTSPQHKAKYLESSCWNFCNFKSRSCGGRGATL